MDRKLTILWVNADPNTAHNMVFMYAINSLKNNWWDEVTVVIWGATAKLAAEDAPIQDKIKMALHQGVKISACKACADQFGVSETLRGLGIEVKYWGQPLTDILQNREHLLSI